jgi:Ser/Thr protein kinase RdoA (MazF antagonist)
MTQGVFDLVNHFADDDETRDLAKRMNEFFPNMMSIIDTKTASNKEGFETLLHNDLHMNNVMYK